MYCYTVLPLDLHVLSLSLAFILSQDQTLRCSNCSFISLARIPSLIVVQGLLLDGTHRYTRFRFLYYLSYYVNILKDRLAIAQQPSLLSRLRVQRYAFLLNHQTFPEVFFIVFLATPSPIRPFSSVFEPVKHVTNFSPIRKIFLANWRDILHQLPFAHAPSSSVATLR